MNRHNAAAVEVARTTPALCRLLSGPPSRARRLQAAGVRVFSEKEQNTIDRCFGRVIMAGSIGFTTTLDILSLAGITVYTMLGIGYIFVMWQMRHTFFIALR